jgi:flavin-dependent dehydrogenase
MLADLDVAVLGGGLAGTLLARQLRRQQPGLRVGLFERERHPTPKVGESTVEIGSHYLLRRHGLSRYLYENHLPKNGLRYFFDTAEPETALTEMSELGTVNLPFHPTFQLDRARLEEDLLKLCGREGVELELGTTVAEVELGSDGAAHRLTLAGRSGSRGLSARWVVDAGGRAGFLAQRLSLREPESQHRIGSVWGRFEGVADVDQLGDDAFRARVRHTARGLSTFHFLRPGYWIWMIPLRGGLTSVGVVGEPVRDRQLRTAGGFRRFLDQHRAVRELLSEAKAVDHGSLARIAYGTRRFFHRDRWAVVGEAATSADPLYSPGIDFIALANDSLADLVVRDVGGEPPAAVAERLELCDGYLRFRHEATMRLYRGLYGMIGSYELMRLKWDFDIASYHNLWVSPFMNGEHLAPAYLRRQLRLRGLVLRVMENFAALFRRTEAELRARGLYYRRNRGAFSYGLEEIDFLEEIGLPRTHKRTLRQAERTFNTVRRNALGLLGEDPGTDWPLQAFATRSLA